MLCMLDDASQSILVTCCSNKTCVREGKNTPRLVGALRVFVKKLIFWNGFNIELSS